NAVDPPEPHNFYQINNADKIEIIQPLYVTVGGGGGRGAIIRFSVTDGVITGYTIVAGGSEYTEPPIITIQGGGGTGATAEATITDGVVTGVTITSGGSNYTAAPEGIVEETSTIRQVTQTTNYQDLTRPAGAGSVSTRTLTATDELAETSPEYNVTSYLGPDGKYYKESGSGLVRTRTMGD
ncbi:MAG: hypothetical protein WC417_02265, partial [Candidatus Omnitrophota bacterium]